MRRNFVHAYSRTDVAEWGRKVARRWSLTPLTARTDQDLRSTRGLVLDMRRHPFVGVVLASVSTGEVVVYGVSTWRSLAALGSGKWADLIGPTSTAPDDAAAFGALARATAGRLAYDWMFYAAAAFLVTMVLKGHLTRPKFDVIFLSVFMPQALFGNFWAVLRVGPPAFGEMADVSVHLLAPLFVALLGFVTVRAALGVRGPAVGP